MSIKRKQAEAYLEEAELSIESAKAALQRGKETGKNMWHSVVKSSYDSMEQAISALLAEEGFDIPRSHPGKVEKFVNEFEESEVTEKVYKWLGKRSKSQYVDIRRGSVAVPHKLFDEDDAEEALEEAEFVLDRAKGELEGE